MVRDTCRNVPLAVINSALSLPLDGGCRRYSKIAVGALSDRYISALQACGSEQF
jgi:hypothetical protein